MKNPKYAKDGHYKLVVVVDREWRDDREVCEDAGRTPSEQLARELQEAWDTTGVAGHFRVYEVDDEVVRQIEDSFKGDQGAKS